MRRIASADSDDGGGLDSLLDTMTNVVGILILVLIATQLGVKDAVSRIADSDVVDPQALAAAEEKLRLTQAQKEALLASLQDLQPTDGSGLDVQLADLRRKIDETRQQVQQTTETANQFAIKLEADRKKADEAKQQLKDMADNKQNKETLQKELNAALEQEAKLKALLDKTPVQKAPPPKIVTLPDPRPAPEGAKALTFLCANNKIYPIAADNVRETVRKRAEFVVQARKLYGGPEVGVNPERFLKEFTKANRTLRDDYFDVELYARGIYPRLRFTPRTNAGATTKEVASPRSRFRRQLAQIDKTQYYARFIVLPDSYDVYLSVRAAVDEQGLLAGWDPQGAKYQYETSLGGPLLFGPKPKPNPNAKPAPPSKPPNVID